MAERPRVRRPGRNRRSRARQSSVCPPRFDAISSCHSSTTTSARCSKSVPASSRVSRSDRLSGVVTSALGRRSRWRARMRAGVSPVRDSTLQGMPRSSTGARSAASVSPASARRGVIQRTVQRRGRAAGRGGIVAQPLHQRTHPGRVRLARAGGGVDQPALAGEVGLPHLLLERERLPLVQREPLAHAVDRLAIGALDHAGRPAPALRRGRGAGGGGFGGLCPSCAGRLGRAAGPRRARSRRAGRYSPSPRPIARR